MNRWKLFCKTMGYLDKALFLLLIVAILHVSLLIYTFCFAPLGDSRALVLMCSVLLSAPFLPAYFYLLPKAVEDIIYSFRFAKEDCDSLQDKYKIERSEIDLTTYSQMEIQKLKEKYRDQ